MQDAAADQVIHASDADFTEIVEQSEVPVLVDFWAPWCVPCKALDPTMKALARDYAGKAKIVKVDSDASPETAKRFGVQGIPNVMLFSGGEKKINVVGVQPRGNYVKLIEGALAETNTQDQLAEMLKEDEFRRSLINTDDLEELQSALAKYPWAGVEPFENGMTPIALRMRRSREEFVAAVLKCNPPLSVRELAGLGRLDELTKCLDEAPEEVESADIDGMRPIDLAVRNGQLETARLLMERGASPQAAGPMASPPISAAVGSANIELVQMLIEFGADITVPGGRGGTLINQAVLGFSQNPESMVALIRLLIDKGVDKTAEDGRGVTPLQMLDERAERTIKFHRDKGEIEKADMLASATQALRSLLSN